MRNRIFANKLRLIIFGLIFAIGAISAQAIIATAAGSGQIVLTTEGQGFAENTPAIVQPVVTVPGGSDGDIVTVTASAPITLTNNTAVVSGGVARFSELTMAGGQSGTGGVNYTLTYSDGNTSVTQSAMQFFRPASLTINSSADTGSSCRWVTGAYLCTTAGITGATVNASSVVSQLQQGAVTIIATGTISISSSINSNTANSLTFKTVGQIRQTSTVTTAGGAVKYVNDLSGPTGSFAFPIIFSSGASTVTNGGNIVIGRGSFPELNPILTTSGVSMTSTTFHSGTGSVIINTSQSAASDSTTLIGSGLQIGLYMVGSTIQASGPGSVNVQSKGIANRQSGNVFSTDAAGIFLKNGSTITTENGNITLNNAAHSASSGVYSYAGVRLLGTSGSPSKVTTSGSGSINITGAVGNVHVASIESYDSGRVQGVSLGSFSEVSTASGNISITGTTGSVPNPSSSSINAENAGVRIGDGSSTEAVVRAGGIGSVNISGTAGAHPISIGVRVRGASVSTDQGSLTIVGTSLDNSNTSAHIYSDGVQLSGMTGTTNASAIKSNSGKIAITGTSGTSSLPSSTPSGPGQTDGVRLGHTVVDSVSGQIEITGTTKGLGSFTVANGAANAKHLGVVLASEPANTNQTYPKDASTASIGANATTDVVIRGLIDSTSTTNTGIAWFSIQSGYGFGGPSATGDFYFYTPNFGGYTGPGNVDSNVDTSGSLIVRPVGADFISPSMLSPASTDPFVPYVVPSSRVSRYEIGAPSGNPSRPLTISSRAQMNSAAVLRVRSGNLVFNVPATPATYFNFAGEINGTVSFNGGIFDKVALALVGATKTVSFTTSSDADGVIPADVGGYTAVWGIPKSLAIVGTSTGSGNAGVSFTSPKVEATDDYGLSLASFNRYGNATEDLDDATTSIALSAATAGSAVLSGNTGPKTLVSGSTGVAFSGLSVDLAGTYNFTYSGSFNGQSLTPVDSGNILIGGGPPIMVLEYPEVTYRSNNTAYSATTKTSTGNGTLSFTASPSSVCTISSSTGAVTAVAGGTCTVVMTAQSVTGPPAYTLGTKTVSFNVLRASQTTAVSITTTSVTYGSTVSLASTGGDTTSAFVYRTTTPGCSISGSTLSTTLDAGNSCSVFAYRAADTKYLDSSEVSKNITIAKASQATVSVPSGTQIAYLASPGIDLTTLVFGGGSGTGTGYAFSTATAGCTITGTTLTANSTKTASSTCSVTVTKDGDTNYNSATATLTVTVVSSEQAPIVVTSTSGTFGATLSVTYTGGSGSGAISYTAAGTCTVNASGVVSFTAAGQGCSITVTKALEANKYLAKSSAATVISVAKANQASLSWNLTSTSVPYLGTLSLATSGGSGTGAVTYSTSLASTCTVSGNTLSVGTVGSTCEVTASKAADDNYNVIASTTQTFSVNKISQTTALGLPSGLSLDYNSSTGLDLSPAAQNYTGGDGTGAYQVSTATAGCSINASTKVLTAGTNNAGTSCVISVTRAADTNYLVSTAGTFTVSINKIAHPTITVTSASSGVWGTNISLTSSTISGNGVVTWSKVSGANCTVSGTTLGSSGAGNCVVKVSVASGTNYLAAESANFTVSLSKQNQSSLSWNLTSTSVPYLGTLSLATSGGSGTGAVVYSVSGASECSIVGTTLIPSDAGSTCEITATKVSDSNYNSADTTTQTITVTKILQATLAFSNANTMVYGQTLDLLATGGSGGGSITYAVSNAGTTGCSLSVNQLSVTGAGTCAVTAVRASSTNYNASSTASLSITVSKASQTVSFTSVVPAEPMAGDTYTVAASASSGLTPAISISSGQCSASGNVVSFTSAGNCVISAGSNSNSQYLAATPVTQTVAVGQRNQTLSFSATVRAMTVKTYGDPAFFAEATTSESTLTPSYSRGSATTNSACSVSSTGVVVILAVGTCEVEVNQAGDAAVAAASAIKKSFEVVPDRANAPFITSVSAGHESITAAFIAPTYIGGSSITGYQLAAVAGSTTITNSSCTLAGSGTTETCSINGLTNGTSYRIKVAAITAAGVGLYSDLSTSRIPATNPAAVSAFTAVPDNTSIVLTWRDPVSLGGGTFDSYRVFYKLSSSANYPSTYINIQSQSPTNYTITGLINGEAYDVKIVTVTTANTQSLVSNTAEVKETPRTVPEAPATIEVLEVGGQLVITWSTPQSDGGNAITEYRVTINGTTCTLANALDNLCTVPVPTNGGTYPIEVKAKNEAGFGSPATATFTKAGVPSSGGSSGGSESSSNGQSPLQVISLSVKSLPNVGGQIVSITGKNLAEVTTVLIDGIKAKIISVTDGMIRFEAPRNTDGPATLTLKSPAASTEVVDAFTYRQGIAKVQVSWVLGFIQANTVIKAADKAKLRSGLALNTGTVAVTCVGYQSYSYNTPKDAQTAMGRAKRACDYLKRINPKLSVKTVIARTNLTGTPSRKLAVQFRAIK